MAIITLTSDWGLKDHYIGAVKGTILSYYPEARIIDITHLVPSFDIEQASFIVKNSYYNFPKGSIHILAVNTEASIQSPHTAVLYDGHYFIAADNGIFSLIFDDKPEKIIEITLLQDSDYFTFSTRDVFAKAACHLAKGLPIEELGVEKENLLEKIHFKPVVEITDNSTLIKGNIIYIDTYGNAVTNITESLFKETGKGRPFTIYFRSLGYEITEISKSYNDIMIAEKLALFNSSGYLEISQNQGNASELLDLRIKESVRIEFAG